MPPNVPEEVNRTASSRHNIANYLSTTPSQTSHPTRAIAATLSQLVWRFFHLSDSAGRIASYCLISSRWIRDPDTVLHWTVSQVFRTAPSSRLQFTDFTEREWSADRPKLPLNNQTMQVDYGDEPGSDHSLQLTANYEHTGNNGNPAFSPFRHPSAGVPAIDPGLERSTGANRNGHASMSVIPHSTSNHMLQADNASLSSTHLAHGFYGNMARNSQPPSTPSNASPRYSAAVSPTSQSKHTATSHTPDDRSLPSRDVSDETIDSAFASFVLYCNPSFALSTDTSELVKLFRTPPKSDGNSFSTWTLFELIRKFSAGEIKTWTQLALDLGVAPPDTDKGQSTQKVQQYSVRLKVRRYSLSSNSLYTTPPYASMA